MQAVTVWPANLPVICMTLAITINVFNYGRLSNRMLLRSVANTVRFPFCRPNTTCYHKIQNSIKVWIVCRVKRNVGFNSIWVTFTEFVFRQLVIRINCSTLSIKVGIRNITISNDYSFWFTKFDYNN